MARLGSPRPGQARSTGADSRLQRRRWWVLRSAALTRLAAVLGHVRLARDGAQLRQQPGYPHGGGKGGLNAWEGGRARRRVGGGSGGGGDGGGSNSTGGDTGSSTVSLHCRASTTGPAAAPGCWRKSGASQLRPRFARAPPAITKRSSEPRALGRMRSRQRPAQMGVWPNANVAWGRPARLQPISRCHRPLLPRCLLQTHRTAPPGAAAHHLEPIQSVGLPAAAASSDAAGAGHTAARGDAPGLVGQGAPPPPPPLPAGLCRLPPAGSGARSPTTNLLRPEAAELL